MSRVGLVLGGGGITGAAYQMAGLMAIRMATGWDPNQADVVVGTSGGAYVAALVRNNALTLDSLVLPHDERDDVAGRIRSHVYAKGPKSKVGTWARYGLGPGVRRPGLSMVLGSPAPYDASGIGEWVKSQIGVDAASGWPTAPTAIVSYNLSQKRRAVFGTDQTLPVQLSDAVAASSAVPLIFKPYAIEDQLYVDGGVSSGTHADLILGHPEPLDLVLVMAPMAADVQRKRARFHEKLFDRVGVRSLSEEVEVIRDAWPNTDVVTLSPSPSVQNAMRPNPMNASKAVATFMRTLISMKRTLGRSEVWEHLEGHLAGARRSSATAR